MDVNKSHPEAAEFIDLFLTLVWKDEEEKDAFLVPVKREALIFPDKEEDVLDPRPSTPFQEQHLQVEI
ncbi:unnamed protein product [Alternaria alternata]